MRPDQHKKKKNAEYKKKHGIQGQNKNTNKSEQSESDSKSALRSEPRPGVDDDTLNSEENVECENQLSFSRRQIESNWDRYKDEDPDTDVDFNPIPTKIGTDFQILLEKKGGPSSHFHFQSEKEWDISENEEIEANPLSIDFKSLAQALRSIPLEERFEIDKKYFEDEHLENANTSSLGDNPALSTNGYLAPKAKTEKSKQTFSPNFSKPKKLSQKSNKSDSIVQVPSSKVQKVQEDIHDVHVHNTGSNHVVNEDEFLNSLLGMETKEIRKPDFKVNIHQGKKPNVLVTNDNIKTDMVPKPPQDTKDDLEDWLDSILD